MPRRAPTPSPATAAWPGLHLLVAEDNPVNLQVAVAMLEGMGARVDVALDGLQAVARCRNGHFDALLLDCQMPAMDGYEAARRIRAEGARRMPIIAVTANAMSADRDLCLAAGHERPPGQAARTRGAGGDGAEVDAPVGRRALNPPVRRGSP